MSIWDNYPVDYRHNEVRAVISAAESGECVSLAGLSGAGKSNVMGYIAHRSHSDRCRFILVDCNRIQVDSPDGFYHLVTQCLGDQHVMPDAYTHLDHIIGQDIKSTGNVLCLLFDRFDSLFSFATPVLFSNLRALRDNHKYSLSYVVSTRHLFNTSSELAELFYANVVWLGTLSDSDACWSVEQYASRKGQQWDRYAKDELIALTRGYPSFLRAACEAYATGTPLALQAVLDHPAMKLRLEEFLADQPSEEEIKLSRLEHLPLLSFSRSDPVDTSRLTSKEHLLLLYFQAHAGITCEKDDLIRAVWPEDQILGRGLRDDSLAQLVRRLREKIEIDPSTPLHIQTIPSRGYRFKS